MEFLLQLMIERVNKSLMKTDEKELSHEEKQKKLNLILRG